MDCFANMRISRIFQTVDVFQKLGTNDVNLDSLVLFGLPERTGKFSIYTHKSNLRVAVGETVFSIARKSGFSRAGEMLKWRTGQCITDCQNRSAAATSI